MHVKMTYFYGSWLLWFQTIIWTLKIEELGIPMHSLFLHRGRLCKVDFSAKVQHSKRVFSILENRIIISKPVKLVQPQTYKMNYLWATTHNFDGWKEATVVKSYLNISFKYNNVMSYIRRGGREMTKRCSRPLDSWHSNFLT